MCDFHIPDKFSKSITEADHAMKSRLGEVWERRENVFDEPILVRYVELYPNSGIDVQVFVNGNWVCSALPLSWFYSGKWTKHDSDIPTAHVELCRPEGYRWDAPPTDPREDILPGLGRDSKGDLLNPDDRMPMKLESWFKNWLREKGVIS